MPHTPPLWTIDELGVQVALALAVAYDGAPNGRTRGIPDQRTIRYYTTLGLLDRAAAMRGRTALYSRRHLLQLVAIKRLQARGAALAEIQQRLLGATDATLQRVAQLPAEAKQRRTSSERGASFWKAAPVAADPDPVTLSPCHPVTLSSLQLAEAVTLLLAAGRPLDDDDIQAIRAVAAPLLKLLDKRRLVDRPKKGTANDRTAVDPP